MSIRIMSMVWEIKDLTPMQKLILLKLADNADDSGVCWPSRDTVAKACGCSTRTVSRSILHFESMGLMKHDRRFNKSNVYKFNSDTMSSLKSNSDTMSPSESLMVTPCPVNGDTRVPLTIKNHKKKSKEPIDKVEALESNTPQQVESGAKPSWHGWLDQSSRHLRAAPAIGAYIFNPKTGEQKEYEGE